MRLVLNLIAVLFLLGVGALVWLGSQPLPDPAWNRVQAAGVLQIGLEPTYRPFEYIEDGAIKGYDVELGRRLAAALGVRAEFVSIALDGQYDALSAGKVDLLISALPKIDERQAEVRYSQPYYDAGPLIIVPAGSAISTKADLAGRRVAVELGSSADMAARALQPGLAAPMRLDSSFHSADEALAALLNGQADAAICDPLSLAAFTHGGDRGLKALQPPLQDEYYVFAVKLDSRTLGKLLDDALGAMRGSGELERIMSDESQLSAH